ncbi:DUF3592 domain-containing protein [Micromonospora sp. DT233]|uniref:DUF3592 domain-containing protein n=1 Tax=Micromonospora sp. DT233 TaxID=3393432 RepID=UPI003CFAFA5D
MLVDVLIQVVGGLGLLVAGVRQALGLRPLGRSGVRRLGTVVRVRVQRDTEEGAWLYAPVIAFRDEHGTEREFTPELSTRWASHERGEQVTVLYPPGHPEAARLTSGVHGAVRLATAGISAVFILVGLFLLGSFVRGLLAQG